MTLKNKLSSLDLFDSDDLKEEVYKKHRTLKKFHNKDMKMDLIRGVLGDNINSDDIL